MGTCDKAHLWLPCMDVACCFRALLGLVSAPKRVLHHRAVEVVHALPG